MPAICRRGKSGRILPFTDTARIVSADFPRPVRSAMISYRRLVVQSGKSGNGKDHAHGKSGQNSVNNNKSVQLLRKMHGVSLMKASEQE